MSRRGRKGGGRRVSNPYKKADRFTKAAKEQGFEARSVFKLSEIQRRFPFLNRGDRVVDLGCFPGSWSRYALQQIGREGRLVGVDFKAPTDLPDGVFLEASALEIAPEALIAALGGPADVLLSDMAPNTVGIPLSDHVRQVALARHALETAKDVVRPGGAFVVKVFDGDEVPDFQDAMRAAFGTVKRIRPEAVRRNSREFFLLGMNRRSPAADTPDTPRDPAGLDG